MTARVHLISLAALLVWTIHAPGKAGAACNLIPGTTKTFNSTRGATNRPFAAPNENVEVRLRPCDVGGPRIDATASQNVVTVVFTPPGGTPEAVVLTSGSCSSINTQLAACDAQLGGGTSSCRSSEPIQVVDRSGVRHLRFRFPDTDSSILGASDDITRAGPAKIAVSVPGDPLPCGLASQSCAAQSDLRVCIDDYYANDGACGTSVALATFPSFTALPPPNDYRADCFADSPPCTATASEVRVALDAAGNMLMPVNWSGVLVRNGNIPVPRLMRAQIKSPVPFTLSDQVFIGSYTPEGGKLPPIFEPQRDPSVTDPDTISLFGSADAPYTILRVARRHGQCDGGGRDGLFCSNDTDCPAGSCPLTCANDPATTCVDDIECGANGPCGENFDLSVLPEVPSGGPVVLGRLSTDGMCQADVAQMCTADCGGDGPCVNYAYEARLPVPLEGFRSSTLAHGFASLETIDGVDRNNDGDLNDSVVTFRDRQTGRAQDLGQPVECVGGAAEGRSVVRVLVPPFRYPIVETEGDKVAFFESEAYESCDVNGDGDQDDPIFRTFDLTGTELTLAVSPPRAPDIATMIDGKALAFSAGRVFIRTSEARMAAKVSERVSVDPGGAEFPTAFPNCQVPDTSEVDAVVDCTPVLSRDGRFVAFVAEDGLGTSRVYLRDRNGAGSTQLIDQGDGSIDLSADGRYLVYASSEDHGPPFNESDADKDIFLYDRTLATTEMVTSGLSDLTWDWPTVSDDGRFVVFAARPLLLGSIYRRDRCVAHGIAVPGCTPSTLALTVDNFDRTLGPHQLSADGRYLAASVLQNSNGAKTTRVWDFELAQVVSNTSSGSPQSSPLLSSDGKVVGGFEYTGIPNPGPFYSLYARHWPSGGSQVLVSMTGVEFGYEAGVDSFSFDFSDSGKTALSGDANKALFVGGGSQIYQRDLNQLTTFPLDVAFGGVSQNGAVDSLALSDDGSVVAFVTPATNVLAPGEDTNAARDVFVYGADPDDPLAVDALLFPDGELDDIVLEVFDTATSSITTLCPADEVTVSGGSAAFLRPESVGGSVSCPAGPLNGDGDIDDRIVHLWPGSGGAINLQRAGTQVALSSSYVGALISESSDGTDYNGDGDLLDDVAQVHAIAASPGTWQSFGQAADHLAMAGDYAVMISAESAQDTTDLSGDGDADDRVLQVYDAATLAAVPCSPVTGASCATGVRQPAAELVVGGETVTHCGTLHLVAFRTSEAEAGNTDLNGDGDTSDDVMQVFDLVSGSLQNTGQAVTPCQIPECDPTEPYKVEGGQVRFLTFEPDQGNQDLTGEGSLGLALQLYDFCNDVTTVIGAPNSFGGDSNPLNEEVESLVLTSLAKRCRFSVPADCTVSPCDEGKFCDAPTGQCVAASPEFCDSDDDCPTDSTCSSSDIVIAATAVEDEDDDGVPDDQDNCETTPNTTQADLDADGVGDACDLQTCGNGIPEAPETCDDANLVNDDACLNTCVAATCGDGITYTGVEDCDDGNAIDEDSCLSDCTPNVCGDGIVNVGVEECDDGTDNDDLAPGACRTTCVAASCGDGAIDVGEECDDGNTDAGDGCDGACVREHPAPAVILPGTEGFTYTESRSDSALVCPIDEVRVVLDVDHASVGDLVIDLTYGATTVRLLDRPGVTDPDPATGGYGGDLAGVYTFEDGGFPFPQSGGALVQPTTYAPEGMRRSGGGGALADFVGLDSGGDWTLTIVDAGGSAGGLLHGWQVVTELDCTYSFSEVSGDPIGPDAGDTTTSVINVAVPGSLPVSSVSVTLDATHTYVGDLEIDVSHGATSVRLMDLQAGSRQFDGVYVFADGYPIIEESGGFEIPPGTYGPAEPLAGFADADANGDWTLTIVDNYNADGGTLASWGLTIVARPTGGATGAAGPVTSCGDGIRSTDEECDDGNRIDGDGCTVQCREFTRDTRICQETLGRGSFVYFAVRTKLLQRCRTLLNRGAELYQDRERTVALSGPSECALEYGTAIRLGRVGQLVRRLVALPGFERCTDLDMQALGTCAATVDDWIGPDGDTGCLLTTHDAAVDALLDDQYGRELLREEVDEFVCQASIARAGRIYDFRRTRLLQLCRLRLNREIPLYRDRERTQPIEDPADCAEEYRTARVLARLGEIMRRVIATPGAERCTDAIVSDLGTTCATTVDGLVTPDGTGGCLIDAADVEIDTIIDAAH